jgi:putative FmdB family regulatory protein
MPTYDYECIACEHLVEDVYQRFSDEPLTQCPRCGVNNLQRVISGGIHGCVKKVDTVGKLADVNASKNRNKIAEDQAKKLEETPLEPKPWHHNPEYGCIANHKEINKMTQQQKIRYIMEGKK